MLRTALVLLLIAPLAAGEPAVAEPVAAETAAAEVVAPAGPLIAYAPIDGMIDDLKARYLKRVLQQAREDKVETLVLHISSDGGELFAGRDMLSQMLAVPEDAPRLVAYVDDRAISAAAMIAYGCQRIHMTSSSAIGNIGVIMVGQDGKIEYAPEKIETVVRGLLRLAAERRGWDKAKLVKMTARNQELYRIDHDGRTTFVLEHDVDTWLADHPHVDRETQKRLVLPKDALLYYNASEAVGDGMATSLVADLDEVYKGLGTERAAVRSYAPTSAEKVSWLLATWAPILFGLAVLCVALELKTPGVGVFAILAALFFALFFVCQYYQELAGNLEIVLVVLGLLAIVAEIAFLPTGGALALGGLIAALAGALLAFMPDDLQFRPAAEGFGRAAEAALIDAALAFGVITAGLAAIIWLLPRSPALSLIAANAEISGTSATADETAGVLIGRQGVARTDLRPGGFAEVAGRDVSAVTEQGEHIAAGTPVEVVAMRYGEAVVRSAGRPGGAA